MPRTGPHRSSLGQSMDSRRDGSGPAANVTPASVHCKLALLLTRWGSGEHHTNSARTVAKIMSCPAPSPKGRRRGGGGWEIRNTDVAGGQDGVQQPQRDDCEAAQNAAPLCRLNDNEPTPSSRQTHTGAQPEVFLAMRFPTGPKLAGCVYWGYDETGSKSGRGPHLKSSSSTRDGEVPRRAHGVLRDRSCM